MHGTLPRATARATRFDITPALTLFMAFTLLALATVTFAQPPGGGRGGARFITGTIEDAEMDLPLAGANVLLFDMGTLDAWERSMADPETGVIPVPDEKALRGTASNDNGVFAFPGIDTGEYEIMVRVIGYETVVIENIEIDDANPRADLGRIGLSSSAVELEEAVVTAEGTDVMLAPDRKIYRVSSSVADAGGSVSDALEEIPSVTVDIEGNVSLRGNSNVRILIDGKPSSRVGIQGGEALQQLPAELVDRVEVMTNPSAKYDAQGDAGILNIVLKKERRGGVNGSVNVSGGYPLRGGIGVNLNYRAGKFNWFANQQLRYRSHEGGGWTDQTYFNENLPFDALEQDEDFERTGWSNYIRVGVEYLMDDANTFTVSVFNDYGEDENEGIVRYRYFDDGALVTDILRTDPENETERFNGVDLGYRHTWDDVKGHEFTADYQFETGSENEISTILEQYQVGSGPTTTEFVDNLEGETRHLAQVDYVHPFDQETKLEAGAKAQLRELDHDYEVVEAGSTDPLDVSNHLVYDERIYAGYATWSHKLLDPLSYQLGLRGELSDVTTEFRETNEINERDYFDLFPSVFVTYEFNPVNSLQASYSRRIQRPHHWWLIPFWNYSDNRNRRQGNPNLDPEFINSYELGHLWHTEQGSVNSSVYYRQSYDVIEWVERGITTPDGEPATLSQPFNVGDEENIGFEFSVIRQFARWLNVQGSFNVFRRYSEGSFQDIHYEREYTTWFTRLSNRLQFTKTSEAQVRFFYMGPRESIQGERDPIWTVDLGLSQSLFDNRATLSFNARDLFDTRRRHMETVTDDFISESEFQWRGRTYTIQFTWRFNQDDRQRRRGNGPGGGFDNGGFDDDGGGM